MTTEIAIVAASLAALSLGVGMFVLPDAHRALMCFLGLSAAIAAFLLASDASPAAWSVLLCGGAICTCFLAVKESMPSGWQNWFVIVVSASTLWLLSLFLLWTLEEALVLPVAPETASISPSEIVRTSFDRFGWVFALLGFLALSIGTAFANRGEE